MKPIITFRANAQKQKGYFEKVLTDDILSDICFLVTGNENFEKRILNDTYNKGRLVCIEYKGVVTYVSLSETENKGRNSSLQSVPSAINSFHADPRINKKLAYYFLPHEGNLFTAYHKFMYKLMATAGMQFLNAEANEPRKFTDIYDLIHYRDAIKSKNKTNNSTYITFSSNGKVQIFAKTYGANKYESTLIGIVCATIYSGPVEIYNICEQDLKTLPESSQKTLRLFSNIKLIDTERSLDRKNFNSSAIQLRSPFYLYNLLAKYGAKSCACCGCPIPEIIQGAHIWNVADIKNDSSLTDEQKYQYATTAENGIWLCSNHHKLFDSNILRIDENGCFYFSNLNNSDSQDFAKKITTQKNLPIDYLTPETINFIKKRNSLVS